MKEVGFMKKATGVIAAAVAVLTVMPTSEVQAQTSNTIFPAGWDRSVRDRMFMRLGAIYVNTKTDSSDAIDLSGPVISRLDIQNASTLGTSLSASDPLARENFDVSTVFGWDFILNALLGTPELGVGGPGLGTPPGVKAKVGDSSTVALSMGYWLTEDRSWSLEAFLLAAPLEVKVYGAGTNQQGKPNGLSGKHIISTKMLPPLAVLSRHFGSPDRMFRPYLGIGATYAVLYDGKTTPLYDEYVGGKSTVTIKNAFGVGPFVGLSSRLGEQWHVNLQVGQIKLKTDAVITTRNTLITGGSPVVYDYSATFGEDYGDGTYGGAIGIGYDFMDSDIVGKTMRLVARTKSSGDLGTFSRKQTNKLTNTIINLSVGYNF